MHDAKLISVTPDAEKHMVYCARVSNPKNQDNEKYAGLLRYCMKHGHWSIFEQAHMTVEINTTRDISAQILRHSSAKFQEFSQRYADVTDLGYVVLPELRRQDEVNKQASHDDLPVAVKNEFLERILDHLAAERKLYADMLEAGIAKECARKITTIGCTPTRMYMTMNVRDWMFYIKARTYEGSQKEHRMVAESIKEIFRHQFPTCYDAFFDRPHAD